MADGEKRMSFLKHLEELRWRLVRCAVVVVIGAGVIFYFTTPLIEALFTGMTKPSFITYRMMCKLSIMLGMEDDLCISNIPVTYQSNDPSGQLNTNVYFAIIGGIVIAAPFIFYQLWQFVKPALKERELRASKGIIWYISLLFFIGILFGYFVISPMSIQFFGTYQLTPEVQNIWDITKYMSLITTTTFYTGLFFELPIVVYFFSRLGIMTPQFMRKYRKHAIIVILIIAAIITPPDMTSQILVSLPLVLLYEISIRISARVQKRKALQEI